MLRGATEEHVGPSTGLSWQQRRLTESDRDLVFCIHEDIEVSPWCRKRISSAEQFPITKEKITTSTTSSNHTDENVGTNASSDTDWCNDASLIHMFDWNTSTDLVDHSWFADLQTENCFEDTIGANLGMLGLDVDLRSLVEKQSRPNTMTLSRAEDFFRKGRRQDAQSKHHPVESQLTRMSPQALNRQHHHKVRS
jgi:hypothetical protein